MKILAIDDLEDNLISLSAMLRAYIPDCEVKTARSGMAGLELARTFQPDTIILDIQMPGMDGFQVCQALKNYSATRHIPIIFLTAARTNAASHVRGLELGGDAFLTKPFEPVELTAHVRAMVRIKTAEDALRAEKQNLEKLVAERTTALQAETAKLDAIFDASPVAMLVLDEKTNIVRANAAAVALAGGYVSERIPARPGDALGCVRGTHDPRGCGYSPDCKLCPLRQGVESVIAGGGTIRGAVVELDLMRGDNIQKTWIRVGAQAIDVAGNRHLVVALEDITKQRMDSEALLVKDWAVNSALNALAISELGGHLTYVNPAFKKLWGYEPTDDLVGMSVTDFWKTGEEALAIKESILKERGWSGRMVARTKSGELRHVEVVASLVIDNHGKPISMLASFADVTAQMQAEEALRRSEEAARSNNALLRSIMESQPGVVIFALDTGYRYTAFTEAHKATMKQIWGVEIALDVNMLGAISDPEDRAKARLNFDRAIAGEHFVQVEEYGDVAFKRTFYENRYAPIHDHSGVVAGLTVFVTDITDRKKAEDALRMSKFALDHMADSVYWITEDARFFYVNQAACRYLGYTEAELLSLSVVDVDPGFPMDRWPSHWEELRKAGVLTFGTTQRTKDGKLVPVEVLANYMVFDGRAYNCAFARDISERKRLEAALANRIVALTRPLDQPESITFDGLFDINDIQRIQDEFSSATGVASIITRPDGTPITKPSNFCRLCRDIIRCTEAGLRNCFHSDAMLGRHNPVGPTIQPCLSGGLWDAGASITVGDRHVANWLIGQVRDETQSEDKIIAYARSIGADEAAAVEAFREVPAMSHERFTQIAEALFVFARQLSTTAYQNVQQARFITERRRAEAALVEREAKHSKMIANIGDVIVIIDATGINRYKSPNVEKWFGWRPEDVFGMKALSNAHPDDQPGAWKFLSSIMLHPEGRGTTEFRYRRKDGTYVWVEFTAMNLLHDPDIQGVLANYHDINQRRQAETAMREAEWKFRALFEHGPVGVAYHRMIYDENGNPFDYLFLDANYNYFILTGIDPRGKTVREAFPGIENNAFDWIAAFGHVAKTGEPMRVEEYVEFNHRWYDVVGYQYKPDHFVATFTEITSSKLAEAALRENEERFRSYIEHAPSGVFIADETGHYIQANPAAGRITGYSQEELVGMHVSDIITPEYHAGAAEHFQRVAQTGQASGESAFRHKDGSIGYWQVEAVRLSPNRFLGFVLDITERKNIELALRESESRFRTVLESMSLLGVMLDRQGRITLCNDFLLKLTGWKREEVMGLDWFALFLPPESSDHNSRNQFLSNLSQGIVAPHFENEIVTRTGDRLIVGWNNTLIRDHSGTIQGVAGIGEDITERRNAVVALEASLSEKESLLREIHHRVKNNLQIVTSLLRLQSSQIDNPSAKNAFREMQGRVRSMALIHEYLYRSHNLAHVDLASYLKGLCQQLFRAILVKPDAVQLRLDLASVRLDVDQAVPCGLIVNELVSNCLKHGFPDGLKGEVVVQLRQDADKPEVHITVSDNGAGISEGFTINQGKTLGLQLVTDLTRQLEGKLTVKSGATSICLWPKPEETPENAHQELKPAAGHPSNPQAAPAASHPGIGVSFELTFGLIAANYHESSPRPKPVEAAQPPA